LKRGLLRLSIVTSVLGFLLGAGYAQLMKGTSYETQVDFWFVSLLAASIPWLPWCPWLLFRVGRWVVLGFKGTDDP